MRSRIPKVLHPLAGVPLISYVLEAASSLAPGRTVIVVGCRGEEIKRAVSAEGVAFAVQDEPRGTGHAVLRARPHLRAPLFLVLPGDVPLVPGEALRELVDFHVRGGFWASFLSFVPPTPGRYGRVVRREGQVVGIEPETEVGGEASSGIWCLANRPEVWEALSSLPLRDGEVRLDDLAGELAFRGAVGALLWPRADDLLGVDSRRDLASLESLLRDRTAARLLEAGVSLPDPAAVYISPRVEVGKDTIIYPGTHLLGDTEIGEGCRIGPSSYLIDSRVESGASVWFSVLEGAWVEQGASVGPFAHLRPGSRVGTGARVGNFVELKNARLGAGAKAAHLSYIGDAEVGERANIGAGTITCNYDGVRKRRTEIGPGAFIGSNSALVAPVRIGEGAYVGAGSVITEDVPPYALALGRARQVVKPDWARKRREAE